jgi:hypothetical protein
MDISDKLLSDKCEYHKHCPHYRKNSECDIQRSYGVQCGKRKVLQVNNYEQKVAQLPL